MEKIKIELSPNELTFALLAVMAAEQAPITQFPSSHDAMIFKSMCADLLPRIRKVKQTLNLPYYLAVCLESCLQQYNQLEGYEQGSLLNKVQPHLLPKVNSKVNRMITP